MPRRMNRLKAQTVDIDLLTVGNRLVFQAMPKCWELNKSACADAITLLERAIQLDPNYALAYALLSWCYGQWVVYNWTEQVDKHRGNALEIARRAGQLDNTDPLVLTILASAECTAGDIPAAKAHIQRALEIDSNSAWGWIRSGYINAYQGNAQVALDDFQRALRLSPLDPMRCNVLLGMALAHFVDAEFSEAVDYFERSLIENPDAQWVHRGLAAAAAMAGDNAKASRSVEIVREYASWIRLDDIVGAVPYRDDQVRIRFRQGLQRAGFSD